MMDTVHIFISTGRFHSFEEMRYYIDKTYTDDGDGIPSEFMKEVGFAEFEPGCIEAIPSKSGLPVTLPTLLSNASYSEQWLHHLSCTRQADAAILVFSPNTLETPELSSLEYLGRFEFYP
jgi:hypothetical protein